MWVISLLKLTSAGKSLSCSTLIPWLAMSPDFPVFELLACVSYLSLLEQKLLADGPWVLREISSTGKCWKTSILCLFPSVVSPRLLAALLSPKIYHDYLTKPFFLQAPSPVCDCHNQPRWGHDTGNGCTGNAGVAIPGVALEPCLCRKVLQFKYNKI